MIKGKKEQPLKGCPGSTHGRLRSPSTTAGRTVDPVDSRGAEQSVGGKDTFL